ncbi:hypothetical protein BH11BAC3_BH11BAC3_01400 [soil metagenome]
MNIFKIACEEFSLKSILPLCRIIKGIGRIAGKREAFEKAVAVGNY